MEFKKQSYFNLLLFYLLQQYKKVNSLYLFCYRLEYNVITLNFKTLNANFLNQ